MSENAPKPSPFEASRSFAEDRPTAWERGEEQGMTEKEVDRRAFLKAFGLAAPVLLGVMKVPQGLLGQEALESAEKEALLYAMGVDISKCIGCARCAVACKAENHVPAEEHFFNTWIERYVIRSDEEVLVDSPNGGIDGFPQLEAEGETLRTFFVPKLCNHCEETPCTQVCPVGASYTTKDGVVLVDKERCIGCGYCVQACPYGSRYIDPRTRTADKCTWCYHRITKGEKTACVQICPVGARMIGDRLNPEDPINDILARERILVLQPELLTKPQTYYLGLDMEVR